jgi:hypothetical protein
VRKKDNEMLSDGDRYSEDEPPSRHPEQRVDPRTITPEKIASAGKMSAEAQLRIAGLGSPKEYTQADYTATPDPRNPGFLTNGCPILPDTSEVENDIRYSIPCFKPSRRGGVVKKRFARVDGKQTTTVTGALRVYDQASTTVVRYDGEAECVQFKAVGVCNNPATTMRGFTAA